MEIKEFHALIMSLVVRMPRFAPDFGQRDGKMAIWYNDLKHISPAKLVKGMNQIVRSQKDFPSIHELLKACGEDTGTDEEIAGKAAEKVLLAAYPNGGGRRREDLGELAFYVSQAIGGFYDILEMNMHDASVYNTQRRRLTAIALSRIREKRILETASTVGLQKSLNSVKYASNIEQGSQEPQGKTEKYKDASKVNNLIHYLKGKFGKVS